MEIMQCARRCLGVQNSSKIPGGQAGQHAPSPEQGPQSLSLPGDGQEKR